MLTVEADLLVLAPVWLDLGSILLDRGSILLDLEFLGLVRYFFFFIL